MPPQLVSSNPTVFRSLALEDEEDNVKALMTFSSSLTTAAPSHMSTIPQHSKTKYQKCKTFHSKLKTYTTLTKKPSTNAGMRSNHSSMEKQPSPMANANGMVFNSYLKKIFGRNHQSSKVSYIPAISFNFGKSPGYTTPCSAHFSHTLMH